MAKIEGAEGAEGGEQEQDGTAELSLHDELMAAFDEAEKAGAGEGEGAAADGADGADGPKPGETEGASEGDGDRVRDPSTGRFVKKTGEKPEGEQPPAKPGEQQPAAAAKPAAPAQQPAAKPGDQPPAGTDQIVLGGKFSDADKQMIARVAAVDPRAAQWLVDRHKAMEGDYQRKVQPLAELHREYAPIHEMFKPWTPRMQAAGFTPGSLIKAWASVEQELMSGDANRQIGIIKRIIGDYKLDPNAVGAALGLVAGAPSGAGHATGAGAAAGAEIPTLPPEVAKVFQPFLTELQGLKQWQQQQDQLRQQADDQMKAQMNQRQRDEYTRIGNEIETFRTETDKDGKTLLRPFFDEVEQDMSMLAQVARARGDKPTLQQLYETAVWTNPATRAKAQAAASAAQQAQAQQAARVKAAAARRAGASVTGSPATGQTPASAKPKSSGSLREDLEAAFEDVTDN